MAGKHYANEQELESAAELARQLEQKLEPLTGLKKLALASDPRKLNNLCDLLRRVGTTLKRYARDLGDIGSPPEGDYRLRRPCQVCGGSGVVSMSQGAIGDNVK
jgi:hypothetical protein